jgi:hypothetical protein
MHMNPRLLVSIACLLALVSTGCRYTGPYVTERTPVEVAWKAGPSTTVYAGQTVGDSPAIGEYSFLRYEGTTMLATPGVGHWGFSERREGMSSRSVAQPLGTKGARLKSVGDGAELEFDDGVVCQLVYVRGSWADYLAGREIVLQLDEDSWTDWTCAMHDAFLDLVDDLRQRVRAELGRRDRISQAETPDILVHEKPLIRADRQQMLIFFERLEVSSKFEVIEQRRDEGHVWWIAGYGLTPDAKRFLTTAGEVTARLVVDVGLHMVHAAAHCR